MHRALRQTIIYFFTIAGTQGLSFLLLPVVTAYLSPEVYGEYTLALSVASLVAALGSSWVRNVSFRLFYVARAAGRTRAFFLSVALFQAGLLLVLYVPTALVLGGITKYVSLPVLLAAGVAALASDFYSHSVALLRAEQRPTQYCVAEISSALVRFAGTLAGLMLGIRSPSLLFLSAALSAGVLGVYASFALRSRLTGSTGFEWQVVRELVRHGPGALPLSVSGWAERLMDRLVLDHYLTREVVGVYTANFVLANRLIGGITATVFMMAWPEILRSWTNHGKEAAREALTRGMTLFLWLTVGPAVFIAAFHRELALMLGPEYRAGSEVMPVIVAATWLAGFKSYLNRHLELGLRFATLSWISLGGAALNLLLNLLLVPLLGIQGSALAMLGNLAATALVFWFIRDRELVALPVDTIINVAMLVVAALLLSLVPGGTYQRLAIFIVVYAAGAGYAVSRRFRKKQISIA